MNKKNLAVLKKFNSHGIDRHGHDSIDSFYDRGSDN